ncbi:F0F1 ATP synthase subunit alpha [Paraburkholderia bryophila]|uniref:F0F1 ATP synthase subunit alpha n=1 Tax=Paraburkholderia bryophila TaxID=420952 RepID=UPI0038B840E7
MTQTTLESSADAWLERSRATLAKAQPGARADAVGRVEHVADGIALVSGLPGVRLNELLRFDGGRLGFALTLDVDAIGAVLLDDGDAITAGSIVTGTGQVVRVPVGPGLAGRVVDPLGRPLDDGGPVQAEARMPIERPAPGIIERDLVAQPLATGILLIDALFAIGRGQRELIIGDRATGKTAIAIDTIVNQKNTDVICVYVAIGQRASAVERVIAAVREHGAPERCVFVFASAAASAGLQWIAPFSAMTIAEYFRDKGQHALIVIDDLTRHAATHRELALLTREPPGREAYPGDIFYLHARLLERAAKLCAEGGGGSLTALPIAETDAGNLSAYIPTNLISITDGQIVLDTGLFAANQRPAVDVGLSVSRVGGKAQMPALRNVSGRLRLDYSQFLELEMFSRFGGLTDARVKGQVVRGERIRALITQPRFTPLRPVDEVAILGALAEGVFDTVPVDNLPTIRTRLGAHLDAHGGNAGALLKDTGNLDNAALSVLVAAVRALAQDCGTAAETPSSAGLAASPAPKPDLP